MAESPAPQRIGCDLESVLDLLKTAIANNHDVRLSAPGVGLTLTPSKAHEVVGDIEGGVMPEPYPFAVGEVVRLKCGGPEMVIDQSGAAWEKVHVVYFAGDEISEDWIRREALEPVTPPAAPAEEGVPPTPRAVKWPLGAQLDGGYSLHQTARGDYVSLARGGEVLCDFEPPELQTLAEYFALAARK